MSLITLISRCPVIVRGGRIVLLVAACLAIVSCASKPEREPMGRVTHIEIHKAKRTMLLYSGDRPMKRFRVNLGSDPVGHKIKRGDGKTPVGSYVIDRRNPASSFHLSLGISYPNEIDKVLADYRGVDPGDNIFIHGEPNDPRYRRTGDWTDGCIAVTDREMDYIYRKVAVGTPVYIFH